MNKMVAMSIYCINPLKSSPEPEDRNRRNLVCSIGDCSYDYSGLTLIYFTARSNFATYAFIWENVTILNSLEIIAACDLKVSKLKCK